MVHLSIEPGIIANGWPIELHSLAQRETTVFLECVYDFDTIIGRSGSLTLSLLLSDKSDSVAYGVSRAAMSWPGISNKEQYSSYRTIQRAIPLIANRKNQEMGTKCE